MANLADWAANLVMNLMNRSLVAAPAGAFVALSTGSPSNASLLYEIGTASGYARVAASWGAAAAASPCLATNLSAMTFGMPSGFSGAVAITGIALMDSALNTGAGNMVWYGTLATPRSLAAGDQLIIAVGNLTSWIA